MKVSHTLVIVAIIKRHRESFHESANFCYKCDYKAKFSQTKQQKEFIHEDVRYSCDSCDGNAIHQNSLKTNKELIHKSVKYPGESCDCKVIQLSSLKRHRKRAHEVVRNFEVDTEKIYMKTTDLLQYVWS